MGRCEWLKRGSFVLLVLVLMGQAVAADDWVWIEGEEPAEHKVMEKYGAWGDKNMYGKVREGVIRSTVIIDPQGRVAHHWKPVKAAGHAGKVQEKLEALQAAA